MGMNSKWKPAFKEGKDEFPNTLIELSSIPVWMKPSDVVIAATIPVQSAVVTQKFELQLKRDMKNEMRSRFN